MPLLQIQPMPLLQIQPTTQFNEYKNPVDMGSDSNRYTAQRYNPWAVAQLSTRKKNRNGANLKLRHTLRAGGVINISSEILSGSIVVLVLWRFKICGHNHYRK